MKRREIGFLLIGLGVGLIFGLWAVIALFKSLERANCIFNLNVSPLTALIPVLPFLTGVILLLLRSKKPPA
jgi:uncharacterized membrane protein YidH (DUF202 family)